MINPSYQLITEMDKTKAANLEYHLTQDIMQPSIKLIPKRISPIFIQSYQYNRVECFQESSTISGIQ